MMSYELENIAILNAKGAECRCVLFGITKEKAINMLNNYELIYKGTLEAWILGQLNCPLI